MAGILIFQASTDCQLSNDYTTASPHFHAELEHSRIKAGTQYATFFIISGAKPDPRIKWLWSFILCVCIITTLISLMVLQNMTSLGHMSNLN